MQPRCATSKGWCSLSSWDSSNWHSIALQYSMLEMDVFCQLVCYPASLDSQEFLLNWQKALSFANIDSACYMLHESKSAILIIAYNITAAHITCAFQYGIKLTFSITYLCISNFHLVSFKDIIFFYISPFSKSDGKKYLAKLKNERRLNQLSFKGITLAKGYNFK